MFILMAVLALGAVSADDVMASGPAQTWAPLNAYVGFWRATLPKSDGNVTVTRHYEASADNQRLEVSEQLGRNRSTWGVISYEGARGGLVLRRSPEDGSPTVDMVLQPVSNDGSRLVFVSEPDGTGPAIERITFERLGWNDFVERQESAVDGATFTLDSEVMFHRIQ